MTGEDIEQMLAMRKPTGEAPLAEARGYAALPEHLASHERERNLRYILRQILETPHNPGRWERWARRELEAMGPQPEAQHNTVLGHTSADK
jgi:hypothetical protein